MAMLMKRAVSLVAAAKAGGCDGFIPDAASLACYFKGCATRDASGQCQECCAGCHLVDDATKGKYCMEDDGPSPSPSPSGDSWDSYTVAGMDVMSVTGGSDKSSYEKVVVMLHGGGGKGSDWQYQYQSGWFGDLTGFKYVFPTSPLQGHVWFNTLKNGCGLNDDCAYDIPSIEQTAEAVAALIEHERNLLGGDAAKVFLAGFSEGAQLTGYMQLAKLEFALGGTIVMDGYPIPPLCDMPGASQAAARANATYIGADMKWMIYHGSADPIFPEGETMTAWHGIFAALNIQPTLKLEHVEPGMTHTLIKAEFDLMIEFIRGAGSQLLV
jgi:predicted esterase